MLECMGLPGMLKIGGSGGIAMTTRLGVCVTPTSLYDRGPQDQQARS